MEFLHTLAAIISHQNADLKRGIACTDNIYRVAKDIWCNALVSIKCTHCAVIKR